jgi:hypothetical protein
MDNFTDNEVSDKEFNEALKKMKIEDYTNWLFFISLVMAYLGGLITFIGYIIKLFRWIF